MDGYSKLAKPLHSIANLKEGHKFQDFWTEHCTMAFETLKQKLVSAPLLGYPDFSKEFDLEIDASFHGLSAVLSQQQDHGLVVISYASRGLRKHERNMNNYSSMKLEVLALYWAETVKFRDLLIGSKFVVFTDNNLCTTTARVGATEMRWIADLVQFNFSVKYRSGMTNRNADALSRKESHGHDPDGDHQIHQIDEMQCFFLHHSGSQIPTKMAETFSQSIDPVWFDEVKDRSESTEPAFATLASMPAEEIAKLQKTDNHIARVIDYLSKGKPTTPQLAKEEPYARKLLRQWSRLCFKDKVLFRVITESNEEIKQMIIPECLRDKVLSMMHDELGHAFAEKTLGLIKKRYY